MPPLDADLLGLFLPRTWELPQGLDQRDGEAPAEAQTDPTTLIGGSVDEAHSS